MCACAQTPIKLVNCWWHRGVCWDLEADKGNAKERKWECVCVCVLDVVALDSELEQDL